MSSITIVVADDHDVVREGLVAMLGAEPGLQVVAHTASGEQAVEMALQLAPDVLLVDVSMPDLNGIEVVRAVRRRNDRIRIMALTMHPDPDYAHQFTAAGGNGYWLKESSFSDLASAVRHVAAGDEVIAERVLDGLIRRRAEGRERAAPASDELTFRERQVLQLVCQGYSSKQIGRMLKISVRTVEQHRAHLMQKTGIGNTAGLVNWAVANKLVAPPV